jgi:hypothetical protein
MIPATQRPRRDREVSGESSQRILISSQWREAIESDLAAHDRGELTLEEVRRFLGNISNPTRLAVFNELLDKIQDVMENGGIYLYEHEGQEVELLIDHNERAFRRMLRIETLKDVSATLKDPGPDVLSSIAFRLGVRRPLRDVDAPVRRLNDSLGL